MGGLSEAQDPAKYRRALTSAHFLCTWVSLSANMTTEEGQLLCACDATMDGAA